MATDNAFDPNEIGPGYSDDELEDFDEDAVLRQYEDAPSVTESNAKEDTPTEENVPAEQDASAEEDAPAETEAKDDAGEEAKNEKTDDTPPKDDYWLPKSRYDFAQSKRREAEAELERVRQENADLQRKMQEAAQTQQTPPDDKTNEQAALEEQLKDLDRQVEAARLDGDVDKAAELAGQIRQVERQIFTTPGIDVQQIREQAANEARQSLLFDQAAKAVEQRYSVLNPEHADYNQEIVDELSEMFGLYSQKYDSVTALNRAVGYVMRSSEPPPPTPNEKPSARKTNFKKNVEAAQRMPPEAEGFDSDRGGPTRKLDPATMTIEEFEQLSDEDEERLLA